MNKIETFSPTQITGVEAHLAWASLEVLADDVNEVAPGTTLKIPMAAQ